VSGGAGAAESGAQGVAEGRLQSLAALQCELRQLFASRPTNRALAEALAVVGTRLEATYAVVHTRLGVHVLSEEWAQAGRKIGAEARERINQVLWESVSCEESRAVRLAEGAGGTLMTVVTYDRSAEPSGGAAIVVPECSKERALQVLAWFEGILGYLALLLDGGAAQGPRPAERREIQTKDAASHPLRLARAILADLETRYGVDLAAVGFVRGERVEVVATSASVSVREANPGIVAMRAAMEECLDRGAAVVHAGSAVDEDCRLHAQWSRAMNGSPVASFPLLCLGETVAVVSVSQGAGIELTEPQVVLMAEELSGYAALVPLSLRANRSLLAHARDAVASGWRRLRAHGALRLGAALVLAVAALGWLAFGTMHFTFTVPCVVKASERRSVACPRSGVLAELFARPGDRVRQGQLLASIDASDDYLQRAELAAEIESVSALVDQAVAERDSGKARVQEARRNSLQAQLAIVDASIAQAQIRAPHDALVLDGDLRERLGSRIEIGTTLFELASFEGACVELRIPERLVLDARDWLSAEFAPASRPDRTHRLAALRIAPSSRVVDQRNVFLGEAAVDLDLGMVPPGMEGVAHVDAGPRSVWWILSHRLTDWLHLNFWL